jgi:prepilin-type processing-associated H-X9-DG protein
MTVWHDPNQPQWSFWQYRQSMMTVSPGTASQFDNNRHGKSMNVAFVDGHTATRPISQQSLSKTLIWRKR